MRLARRLDAGEAPDGSDELHDALDSVRPASLPVAPDTSERLWAAIAGEIEKDQTADPAQDRAPLRLVPRRVVRWAAAAAVLLALGAGLWQLQRAPNLVAAAEGEIVTWEAPDGSTVTLRPNSRLVRLDDGTRAYRLEGEAFFAVASDPDHPFTVATDRALVRVLGTRFDVSTWGAHTEVFVEEGRVGVRGGEAEVVLEASEAAVVSAAGIAVVEGASADAFLDWRRGEAVFERAPVRRVVDELAQHFDVVIAMDGRVAQESVSGVIALESAEQALGELGRILGGRFVPIDGGYRFARP